MINISKLPTGKRGTIYDGIEICDRNRATKYEKNDSEIQILANIRDSNYLAHNVHAVLFGVRVKRRIYYAIFCEEGFVTEIK